VFILGVNFPEQKLVKVRVVAGPLPVEMLIGCQRSLETFYGIGPSVCERLMARFYIHPTAKIGGLANKQVQDLTAALSNMKIENDLRRRIRENIKRLRDMGSYRGRRHAMSLPVRGQRTRTQVRGYQAL